MQKALQVSQHSTWNHHLISVVLYIFLYSLLTLNLNIVPYSPATPSTSGMGIKRRDRVITVNGSQGSRGLEQSFARLRVWCLSRLGSSGADVSLRERYLILRKV